MKNPYNQPGEYVSTKINWFNPNSVAHYTLPVSQATVEEATNSMVNSAIANKQRHEAAAQAEAEAEAQAEAVARAQAQAEAEARAKAKAEAEAAAVATRARQDQEIRLLLDDILCRPTHPSAYSQATSDAFHSAPNVPRDVPGQGTNVGQRVVQEQTTGPPPEPAREPTTQAVEEPCCEFDYCDGFCRFIQNP